MLHQYALVISFTEIRKNQNEVWPHRLKSIEQFILQLGQCNPEKDFTIQLEFDLIQMSATMNLLTSYSYDSSSMTTNLNATSYIKKKLLNM